MLISIARDFEAQGDDTKAWAHYIDALQVVPDPDYEQPAMTQILKAMGEIQWRRSNYAKALQVFQDAVRCRGGLGDTVIHLRLGQCYYELDDRHRAADNLARAYMSGGREAFAAENPKYFALVEEVLKPPVGLDRLP